LLATADLDADGVAEHEVGEPGGALDRDLRRDPSAERDADQRDLCKIERMDEVEIEIGEVVDAIEGFGRLRAAEPGMDRGEEARLCGKPFENGSVRVDADARMQEKERAALATFHYFDLDAVDADRSNPDWLCHRSSTGAPLAPPRSRDPPRGLRL